PERGSQARPLDARVDRPRRGIVGGGGGSLRGEEGDDEDAHAASTPAATTRCTSSASAAAASVPRPSVDTAAWITSLTVPGLSVEIPWGTTRFTPWSETGTTGTPASSASTKLPRLNGRTQASGLRVPSGKTATLVPSWMRWAAASRLLRARKGFPRSIPTCPATHRDQPSTGTRYSERLWMKRKSAGR